MYIGIPEAVDNKVIGNFESSLYLEKIFTSINTTLKI